LVTKHKFFRNKTRYVTKPIKLRHAVSQIFEEKKDKEWVNPFRDGKETKNSLTSLTSFAQFVEKIQENEKEDFAKIKEKLFTN